MDLKKSLEKKAKPKGRFYYEALLNAMPQDIVKELARRRLEEIKQYQAAEKAKRVCHHRRKCKH
jgi:hypothetical protein